MEKIYAEIRKMSERQVLFDQKCVRKSPMGTFQTDIASKDTHGTTIQPNLSVAAVGLPLYPAHQDVKLKHLF